MRDQRKPTSVDPFQLGDLVKLKDDFKGYGDFLGRIIDFRGPLGPAGAFIYGIEIQNAPVHSYIELREDQIEHAPAPARVRRTGSPKVSAGKAKAGKPARPR